ncbi:MAG: hypothetical protein AAF865_04835 [Pseudomonadota bacterium]
MRPVLHGDVAIVARVLYALPDREHPYRLARLLAAAETADSFLRTSGCAHPRYGTGSLMAAAARMPRAPEPDFDDDRYCACWIKVLSALIGHRAQKADGRGVHGGAKPQRP